MINQLFELVYKGFRRLFGYFDKFYCQSVSIIRLYGNAVRFGKNSSFNGIPYIFICRLGKCSIGSNFTCNSMDANPIGRNTKTYIVVGDGASLTIGNFVGMSNTAISCYENIEIEDYVKMGGGVVIYDTDFHSLNPEIRKISELDFDNKMTKPIRIEENAFIGAHSTILKGVTVGKCAIIGACSVVTKDVPSYEVWAGNPAKFIRKITI